MFLRRGVGKGIDRLNRSQVVWFRIQGLEFTVQKLRCRVEGFGFRVLDLGCRV
jgi:hypothetical protein